MATYQDRAASKFDDLTIEELREMCAEVELMFQRAFDLNLRERICQACGYQDPGYFGPPPGYTESQVNRMSDEARKNLALKALEKVLDLLDAEALRRSA